ncbi:hypothetical protein KY495_05290 [Massilia sp. PAMC28688]|uniref:hypothetical protein n=1 Tax=Massilia sp. PAMC28688 TaxID=2861283 RepID=UPI001C62A8A0|nr:hypothetical protein [Massilia sp. PAMC28688]QYF94615.1 hypothetical protein KY495_05290 [Massilia sp. PAMC28688]
MSAFLEQVKPSSGPASGTLEWGDVALAAQAEGSMKPAWTAFLKRKFYVPILRSPDDNPKHYLLHFERDMDSRRPVLIISEVRERLDLEQGDGLVALSGLELLLRLDGQSAMRVVLRDSVFNISKKRGAWLRSGIEETKARVVIRQMLEAASPGGPFPVLRVRDATPAAPLPVPKLATRLRLWCEDVRDARYFVPVVLSVTGIGMLWVLGGEPAPAPPPAAPVEAAVPVRHSVAQAAGPAVTAAVLHAFAPPDHSFSVHLPGMAEEVELSPDQVAQMEGLAANYYRYDGPQGLYEMSVIRFGERMPANTADELAYREQLVVGADGTLVAANAIALRGARGREVHARLPDGTERFARFAFNGDKLCMVMVTIPAGTARPPHLNTILQSFQLVR